MTARRILLPQLMGQPETGDDPVVLPTDIAHHLQSVLRLGDGEPVEVAPGDGRLLRGTLRTAGRSVVLTDLVLVSRETARPAVRLAPAIIKGKRMDWLVEKVAEAGVDVLSPWTAERSAVKLDGQRRDGRSQRWQTIADGASRQCGRLWRPVVEPPAPSLDALLHASPPGVLVVADEATGDHRFPEFPPPGPWTLLTGPEGGFGPTERALLDATPGVVRVGLGKRLLRAETAALVLVARWVALVETERATDL